MSSNPYLTPFGDKVPVIHAGAYIDVSARIIGAVTVAEGASIWPMAVLRADSDTISIGRDAAVLDLALVEAPDGYPVVLDDRSLVSHGAIVHGARIASLVLVGIGSIVLDGAVIESGSIIGAGALVTAGMHVPPNSLVLGSPGKVVRQTTEQERARIARQLDELFEKSRTLIAQCGTACDKGL